MGVYSVLLTCSETVVPNLNFHLSGVIRASSAVGGTLAGLPWGVIILVVSIQMLATGAWRIYERPELMDRWLDVRERRNRIEQSKKVDEYP